MKVFKYDLKKDDELNSLEQQLFNALDKIKVEKARRIFKEEINHLKVKLGIKNQKNPLNG